MDINDVKNLSYRAIASAFGAPVDIATLMLRPLGYTTGDQQTVGSSEWIGRQLEKSGLIGTARNPVAELVASLLIPGPGELSAAAKAPLLMGMLKSPMGRIAETSKESTMLAEMLQRAAEAKGYNVTLDASRVSPSRYVTLSKPGDEVGDLTRQVRISNHGDKYPELAEGVRISSDPSTGLTFENVINWLKNEGYPTSLSTRYKDVPNATEFYAQKSAQEKSARDIQAAKKIEIAKTYEPTYKDVKITSTKLSSGGRRYDVLNRSGETKSVYSKDIPDEIKTNPNRNVLYEKILDIIAAQ